MGFNSAFKVLKKVLFVGLYNKAWCKRNTKQINIRQLKFKSEIAEKKLSR